jgi:chemotaxis protein MotB
MSMRRRRVHEEHLNHEAWAIPYGDLMTLLLAFFVTMYAISSVNAGKYRVLSDSLTAAFRGEPRAPQAITVGEPPVDINDYLPITEVNRMFTAGLPANVHMPLPQANGNAERGDPRPGSADPRLLEAQADLARNAALAQVEADVTGAMAELVRNNTVRVQRRGNNVEVQISTDILFGSGVAQLAAPAQQALASLADALRPWPNNVRVEGHTDNKPINTALFRSNWELSAARAASVVRLFTDRGVAPQRLSVVGHGEYQPLQSNVSESGRNANRRVAVVILGTDSVNQPAAAPPQAVP